MMDSLYTSFFFFKQKTAYEMRISDWSSDVCSSDLGDLHGLCPRPALLFQGAGADPGGESGERRRVAHVCAEDDRGTAGGTLPGTQEIGRASCRERVCQYV